MKKAASLFIIFTITTSIYSQGRGKEIPVLKEISGLEVIKSVYPQATGVEKVNEVWFKIVDSGKRVLGYTLSSKPFSEEIIGYHNTTPAIVIMDKDKVIKKVAILSHWETTSYVVKLDRLKFFDNWNGLTIDGALKKKTAADSYTGATITAVAVTKNVEVVLKKAMENKIN
ncbi:MAG: FMN-binding protein [Bacteroidales bacterium]|nr:FMN-binding protein [Bacteroidales bacterium]